MYLHFLYNKKNLFLAPLKSFYKQTTRSERVTRAMMMQKLRKIVYTYGIEFLLSTTEHTVAAKKKKIKLRKKERLKWKRNNFLVLKTVKGKHT